MKFLLIGIILSIELKYKELHMDEIVKLIFTIEIKNSRKLQINFGFRKYGNDDFDELVRYEEGYKMQLPTKQRHFKANKL